MNDVLGLEDRTRLEESILRAIGPYAVAIRAPDNMNICAGSGLLVGPDLVMTCHHVAALFDRREDESDVDHRRRLEKAVFQIGALREGARGHAVEAGLALGPGQVWRPGPHPRMSPETVPPNKDIAFLRLSSPVGRFPAIAPDPRRPRATWIGLNDIYDISRLRRAGDLSRIRLALVHFPVSHDGTPGFEQRIAHGWLSEESVQDNGNIFHVSLENLGDLRTQPTDNASSGAVIFGRGEADWFPLAIHLGVVQTVRVAVSMQQVKTLIEGDLRSELSQSNEERHRDAFLSAHLPPLKEAALSLLDQKPAVQTILAGIDAKPRREDGVKNSLRIEGQDRLCIQPILAGPDDGVDDLLNRLCMFDLPACHSGSGNSDDQFADRLGQLFPGPERAGMGHEVIRLLSASGPANAPDWPNPGDPHYVDKIRRMAQCEAATILRHYDRATAGRCDWLYIADLPVSDKSVGSAVDFTYALDAALPPAIDGRIPVLVVLREAAGAGLNQAPRDQLTASFFGESQTEWWHVLGPLRAVLTAFRTSAVPGGAVWGGVTTAPRPRSDWRPQDRARVAPLCLLSKVSRRDLTPWEFHFSRAFGLNRDIELAPRVDEIWKTCIEGVEKQAAALLKVRGAMAAPVEAFVRQHIRRQLIS